MEKLIGISGLVLLLVFLGCGTREEPAEKRPGSQQQYSAQPRPQAEQLQEQQVPEGRRVPEAQKGELSLKEKYQKEAEERLADLDKKMGELKDRAASASARTRARINKALKNSDKLIENTKQKLGQLREASAETWENLKAEIDKAFDRLQKRYEEGKAALKG
ncbi:MAG: hypothetical protein QME75_10900 [Deltaproteobacteria bacterium]|nr:hypothetical protein [Deltaproteobacteria bacterium]